MPGDLGQQFELDGRGGQSVPLMGIGEQCRKSNISERVEDADDGSDAATNITTVPPIQRKLVPQPRGS